MASAPLLQENPSDILSRYDITGLYAQHLNKLAGFKIVCICDDSTSMRSTLENGKTKWDELRQSIEIVLDIAAAYNVDSDVLFLNRPGFRNVKHISQLNEQFTTSPTGLTPLAASFQMALENNRNELTERKLLILIFTDGSPTSANPKLSDSMAVNEFKETLKNRSPIDKIFVSIIACTDDECALEYLNDWDRQIKNLDIVDDYESEKKEIYSKKKTTKDRVAFSYGDYVVKTMLGSFVREIDQIDERKVSNSRRLFILIGSFIAIITIILFLFLFFYFSG